MFQMMPIIPLSQDHVTQSKSKSIQWKQVLLKTNTLDFIYTGTEITVKRILF